MSYLHDASPTWNGFNYQGKIALLVVFDKILELNKSNDSIGTYNLELEWMEDFSIKNGNEYVSIHQVKNYGSNALASYKSAIYSLLSKLLNAISPNELGRLIPERITKEKRNEIAILIFNHFKEKGILTDSSTICSESNIENLDLTDEIEEKIKNPNELLTRLKATLVFYKDLHENCENLKSACLHIAEPLNPLYNSSDVEDLDNIQNSDISNIEGFSEALSKLSVYQYDDNIFNCSNENMDAYLDERIKKYFIEIDNKSDDDPKCQTDYLKKTRIYLLSLIDQHVAERHQAIRDDSEETEKYISFTKFHEILNQDLYENLDYDAWKLRESYNAVLYSFLEELKEDESKCNALLNLSDNIFLKYPGRKFVDFCLQITPHAESPNNRQSILDQVGLRDSFLFFFSEVTSHTGDIHVKDETNDLYGVITTINEARFNQENRRMAVYRKIRENQTTMPPFNFNVERLIGRIGEHNGGLKYSEVVPKDTKASKEFIELDGKGQRSNKITISEDFKIVDIQEEINRLSND